MDRLGRNFRLVHMEARLVTPHGHSVLGISPAKEVAPIEFEIGDLTFKFVVTILVSLLITLGVILVRAALHSTPSVSSDPIGTAFRPLGLPRTRDELIDALNAKEQRKLLGNVRFVSALMKGTKLKDSEARELALSIVKESARAHYDPLFVAAVIKAESTFNFTAKSDKGARGLMQLLPTTGAYIASKRDVHWDGAKLNDPVYNLRLGIEYLKYLEQKFGGNKEHMLIAYNWGPGNLNQALKNRESIPASTRKYAKKILDNHRRWSGDLLTRLAANGEELDPAVVLG